MDFVPCVKWVQTGFARNSPVKVELTREELQQIISESQADDSDQMLTSDDENNSDAYDFENYDREEENYSRSLGIGSLALYQENERDPHINIPGMDDEDTDSEDDLIKPDDNLILVAKGFRDNSCMESVEIHVYNEDDGSLYVHHDIMVNSCPLCFQAVSFETDEGPSSYIVTGLISSDIHIYDVNMINPAKPSAKLGSKKKDPEKRHKDAVLDLSWNRLYPHVLASSSADKTVALWDFETLTLSDSFDNFSGNVENIEWESKSGHCLLASDSSGSVQLLDCRDYSPAKQWSVNGEASVARWLTDDSRQFFVGTSKGRICKFDTRMDSHVYKFKAHESDVTGVSSVGGYHGLVVSTCVGGDLKVWDVNTTPKSAVFNKTFNAEQIQTLDLNPDNPLIAAVGGAKKRGPFFSVINFNNKSSLNGLLDMRRVSKS